PRHLGVVIGREEAEQPPLVALKLVEAVVHVGGDAAHRRPAAPGQEVLGLGVLEEGVLIAVEVLLALRDQRRNPHGLVPVQSPGKADEPHELAARANRSDIDRHGAALYSAMPETLHDVFEKARTHERLEQLTAAREQDLLPYFRVVESEAGPVVRMEGAERITLGSNNYLGLTQDPRVVQ